MKPARGKGGRMLGREYSDGAAGARSMAETMVENPQKRPRKVSGVDALGKKRYSALSGRIKVIKKIKESAPVGGGIQ